MIKKALGGLLAVFFVTCIVLASTAFAGAGTLTGTMDLIGLNNDGTSKVTTYWTPYIGEASDFNVFLEGNFTATGSDCGGRLAVGGNFSTPYPYSIGNDYGQPSSVALAVIGGDVISGGINASNSNQIYLINSSAKNASFNLSGSNGATLVRDNVSNFMNFHTVFNQLRASSVNMSKLSQDGTVSIVYGAIVCNGSNPKLNVFTMTADLWNTYATSGCELKFNVPTDSAVILNVTGDKPVNLCINGIYFNSASPCQAISSVSSKIMLNFPDSKSLNIKSSFTGSIFAPNADITATNGHLEGQLIAKSFTGPYEFGMKFYNNSPPPIIVTTTTTSATTPTTTTTHTTTSATTPTTTTTQATTSATTPSTTMTSATTPNHTVSVTTPTHTTTPTTTTTHTITSATTPTTTTTHTTTSATTPTTTTTHTTTSATTPTTTTTHTTTSTSASTTPTTVTSVSTTPTSTTTSDTSNQTTTSLTSMTTSVQSSTINIDTTSIPLNTLVTTSNNLIDTTNKRYLDIPVEKIPLSNNPKTNYDIGVFVIIVFVVATLMCVTMAVIKKGKKNGK